MARRVLILGAGGQLGRRVGEVFGKHNWTTIGADVYATSAPVQKFISLDSKATPEAQSNHLLKEVRDSLGGKQLDAIINVAGGFAMGNAADPEVSARLRAMVESSVYSSVAAAQAAHFTMRPGGLLVLPGAAAAFSPTGWSLPYGTAKAAVHHLVRSLADTETAGLPQGMKTVGIAPQVLDTPQNREGMPEADWTAWATLDEVSEKLEAWCSDPSVLENGKVYVINKTSGEAATFDAREPL